MKACTDGYSQPPVYLQHKRLVSRSNKNAQPHITPCNSSSASHVGMITVLLFQCNGDGYAATQCGTHSEDVYHDDIKVYGVFIYVSIRKAAQGGEAITGCHQ